MRIRLTLAAVVALLATAPVQAAPTSVTWPVFISVKAAPHTTNDIRMSYELFKGSTPEDGGWDNVVYDAAGITTRVTDPPSCYPLSRVRPGDPRGAKAVTCPDGTSVGEYPPGLGEDFRVLMGDRNDRFDAGKAIGSFEVHAGTGNDRVIGEDTPVLVVDDDTGGVCGMFTEDELAGDAGSDRLSGRRGSDQLEGGSGNDVLDAGRGARASDMPGHRFCPGFDGPQGDFLRGGSGNDVLRARNHTRDIVIDCGRGRDRAFLDRNDPKPKHCEHVKRS